MLYDTIMRTFVNIHDIFTNTNHNRYDERLL
jgi:hypothetical protein